MGGLVDPGRAREPGAQAGTGGSVSDGSDRGRGSSHHDPDAARRRRADEALRRLERAAMNDVDLPPRVRSEVIEAVAEQRRRLAEADAGARDRAREAAPPAPLPPLPLSPPLPPPSSPAPPLPSFVREEDTAPPARAAHAGTVERDEPATARRPSGPSVWERLSPAFAENLAFGLAAFLMVAAAVYFVTTAWATMTGSERLLVAVGGLDFVGALLVLAARLLSRSAPDLASVERVLLWIVAFFVPLAAVPAGQLLETDLATGLVAALLVVGPGAVAIRSLARATDARLLRPLASGLGALVLLVLLGGMGAGAPVLWTTAAAASLLGGTWLLARRVPRLGASPGTLVATLASFTFAALVVAGRVALAAGTPAVAILGIPPAAAALALAWLDVAKARAGSLAEGRAGHAGDAEGVAWRGVALALAVGGAVVAMGDPLALLVAAGLGAAGALLAASRLPSTWLLLPGLALSAVAYLRTPAPVRELVAALRDRASHALGYVSRPMPLGYYGVTFVPYLVATGLFAWRLHRAGRAARARVLLAWTVALGAGLVVLALATSGYPPGTDLRAPAAVLALQGALWIGLAALLDRWALARVGGVAAVGAVVAMLRHVHAAAPAAVLVLSASGLVALVPGVWLRARHGHIARELSPVFVEIATVAGALATAVALFPIDALLAGDARVVVAATALALLLAALAVAWRLAGLLALAALAWAAAARALALAAGLFGWAPLVVVTASAAPLLLVRGAARLGRRIRHAEAPAWRRGGLHVGVATLVVQAVAFAAVPAPDPWPLALSFVLAAAILARASWLSEDRGLVAVAALEALAAGPALARASGGEVLGAPGLLGLALATGALAAWLRVLDARTGRRRLPPEGVAAVVALGVWATFLGAILVVATVASRGAPPADGLLVAAAGLVVLTSVRAFGTRAAGGLRHDLEVATGLPAGLLLGFVAWGILFAAGAPDDLYPLGAIAAAAALRVSPRGCEADGVAAFLLGLGALALASVLAVGGAGSPGALLVAYALLALLGWLGVARAPVADGTLLLLALLLGSSLLVADRMVGLPLRDQPTLWLLFAAAAGVLTTWRPARVPSAAAAVVAGPIVAVAAALGVVLAVLLSAEEMTFPGGHAMRLALAVRVAAVAFLAAAIAARLYVRPAWRGLLTLGGLVVAGAIVAPLNAVLHGAFRLSVRSVLASASPLGAYAAATWRPDVEIAAVATLVAFAIPRRSGRGRRRLGALESEEVVSAVLLVLALLLTGAEWADPSTPAAAFVLAGAAALAYDRTRHPAWATTSAHGLLLAAALLVPFFAGEARLTGDTALRLAAVFAGLAWLLGAVVLALRRPRAGTGPARAALGRAAVTAAWLAPGAVVADLFASGRAPASPAETALAVGALLPTLVLWALSVARRPRAASLHGALSTFVVLFAFLRLRTGALFFDATLDVHALAVLGLTLLVLDGWVGERLRVPLVLDGLLLAVPVVLRGCFAVVGSLPPDPNAASGLALGAAIAALAGRRLRREGLVWLGAGLANLAVFALWRQHGLVDPALYGAPPGLTLLVAAELLRRRIAPAARAALVVPGIALLYGSVCVQVLRVEEPVHAVVLFGLGLVTAVVGYARGRNAWLVTGVVAIVLDVVGYLARHGFAKSFVGAGLLLLAGLAVLALATAVTRRRRRALPRPAPGEASGGEG